MLWHHPPPRIGLIFLEERQRPDAYILTWRKKRNLYCVERVKSEIEKTGWGKQREGEGEKGRNLFFNLVTNVSILCLCKIPRHFTG